MHEGTKVVLVERSGRIFPMREQVELSQAAQRLQEAQVREFTRRGTRAAWGTRRSTSVRYLGGQVRRL